MPFMPRDLCVLTQMLEELSGLVDLGLAMFCNPLPGTAWPFLEFTFSRPGSSCCGAFAEEKSKEAGQSDPDINEGEKLIKQRANWPHRRRPAGWGNFAAAGAFDLFAGEPRFRLDLLAAVGHANARKAGVLGASFVSARRFADVAGQTTARMSPRSITSARSRPPLRRSASRNPAAAAPASAGGGTACSFFAGVTLSGVFGCATTRFRLVGRLHFADRARICPPASGKGRCHGCR